MLEDNDHRQIGKRLNLFHFQQEAPGMVFWHSRGYTLYRILEDAVRAQFHEQGYAEVRTPQILRRPVWEASGHWQHFRAGMFHVFEDSQESAIKPVSCPGHVYIARHENLSYRALPLRLAEFGVVHRDEPSGTLHGLLRLRQFTQDDGHVFCTEADAAHEVERFCRSVQPFYQRFGFEDVQVLLATRPESRAGDDESWDRAEAALREVLGRLQMEHVVSPGAGAFYGPKLEFVLRDRHGRQWSCGTIQFDLVMPRRFDLTYVSAAGQRRHVVMLHRALYGSLERFLGILLEHHGAALPAFLSPLQVSVVPVAPEHEAYAAEVLEQLRALQIRAAVDDRRETLARRIADAHANAVPFVVILGSREVGARVVTVRARKGQRTSELNAACEKLAQDCRPPFSN